MTRAWMPALAVLAFLAAACAAETMLRPPPPPVDWPSLETPPRADDAARATATAKERAVADAYLRALASPGCTDLGGLINEDAHFSFAGTHDAYGRRDIVEAHEALFGAIEPRRFSASRVLRTDRAQVLEWTLTGEQTADHKPVALNGIVILWTRDDGTVADIHLTFDEAVLQAELGQGPKALRGLPAPPPPSPGDRVEVDQAGTPEEAADLSAMSRVLDALESDEAAYVGAMADDVEIHVPESRRPARGKPAARAYFRAMQRAIARLDTQFDNGWGIGSFVVVEYHIVGEQRAPIGFVPVQKDPLIKLTVVDVAELRDGKIAALWRYDNPLLIASP